METILRLFVDFENMLLYDINPVYLGFSHQTIHQD